MQRVSKAFVGNTEAAEILGVRPANVRKMLVRHGVVGQKVVQETRPVHLYQRSDVERVQRERQQQLKRRNSAKQQA